MLLVLQPVLLRGQPAHDPGCVRAGADEGWGQAGRCLFVQELWKMQESMSAADSDSGRTQKGIREAGRTFDQDSSSRRYLDSGIEEIDTTSERQD